MPEIKNTFTSGKMNKDLDERLIPKNEYRDALNIDIATTEGSDIGSIQNSYGNVKVSSLGISGAKCIGSILNPENQKIIWFVSGTSQDVIAEYDQSTQQVEPVLVDNHGGNPSFLNFDNDYLITGINVIDGMLFWTDGSSEPKKINIDRFKKGVADSNIWTTTSKFVDADNVKTANNVLEENITVIKQYPLDAPTLTLSRDVTGSLDPSSSTLTVPENTTRTSWGNPFGAGTTSSVEYYNQLWTRTLEGAVSSITVTFNQTDDGGNMGGSDYWNNVAVGMTLCDQHGVNIKTSGNAVIGIASIDSNTQITLTAAPGSTIANNDVIGFQWNLKPHRNISFWCYKSLDNSRLVKPVGTTSNSNLQLPDENTGVLNTVYDNKGATVRLQQLVFTPRPNFVQDDVVVLTTPNTATSLDISDEVQVRLRLLEEVKTGSVASNEYRKVFHVKILSIDESITTLDPVDLTNWEVKRESSTAIFEDKFPRFAYRWKYIDGEYSSISAFSEIAFLPTEDGYNFDSSLGSNTNIQNTVSKVILSEFVTHPKDVVSLDVLVKFSDSPSVYKYKTINSTDLSSLTTLEITSDQIHAMLPSNQLLRPYDNVPRTAKAQEITANRLLYANYTNQYNVDEEPRFSLTMESNALDSVTAQKSVKSLRTYQLGASLLDQYGRQTPVFSQSDTCTINVSQEESFTGNEFFAKQEFLFPEWATHLKYYIKEPKGEYYNLTMDRVYESNEEDFVWISFPSSDINKVSEGDDIVLKKRHDGSTLFPTPKTISYKVIAKEAVAPKAIRSRMRFAGRVEQQQFGSHADTTTGYPVKGGTMIRLRGNDGVATHDTLKNMADGSSGNKYIRIGSYLLNTISEYYEIDSVTRVDAGDGTTLGDADDDFSDAVDYYEIIIKKPFDDDINFIKAAPGSTTREEYFELYDEDLKEFEEEFEGRFFCKVLKDDYLSDYVTSVFGVNGLNWGIKSTQNVWWIQNVYSSTDGYDETGQEGNAANSNLLGNENASYLNTTYTFPGSINATVDGASADQVNGNVDVDFDAVGEIMVGASMVRADGSNPSAHAPLSPFTADPRVNSISGNTVTFNKKVIVDDDEVMRFSVLEKIIQDHNLWAQDNDTNAGAAEVQGVIYKRWNLMGPSNAHPDGSVNPNGDRVLVPNANTNHKYLGRQRYVIDQAWSWKQISYGDVSKKHDSGPGKQMGHGFRVGSKDVDFRLINFGPGYRWNPSLPAGYIFHNHKSGPDRKHIEENFTLYQALGRKGTRFRWTDDPTESIYTVKKSELIDVNNFTNVGHQKAGVGNGPLDPEFESRENQGIKWHLELDKPVAWSPCQRYYPEDGGTTANPGKINPFWGGAGSNLPANSSELQILEAVKSRQSFSSFSPAVFEVQPKEVSDLNLYYETPKSALILKDDMYIDTSVVKPDGTIDTAVFDADSQIYLINNILSEPSFGIKGNSPYAEQNKNVVAGSYVTIYTKDGNSNRKFEQKLLIVNDVAVYDANVGNKSTPRFDYKIPLYWWNCYAYGNGVESNRIKDTFNKPTIDNGPRVSTTFMDQYQEEKKPNGIIFSGIYNGTSSVNNLNQFIMAENITKDLNPSYGSIQKLFTRNTNVVTFCEHKTLKILANKDALFNADGNTNVTSTSKVLGQTIPFAGEFGISKNPESFANYGYRVYYTDKNRNAVLRLSADGITPISDKNMSTFFKEHLSNADDIIGSYDEDKDTYNLTLNSKTVSFSESVNGWTSLKSFLPENGFSVSGDYYTIYGGELYQHNSNLLRNYFYGTQYESSVKLVFNDEVSLIKNFNTLNYEGSTSRAYNNDDDDITLTTNGWYASSIETDKQSGQVIEFKEKEGKWFNNIIGVATTDANVDTSEFTMQGLGVIPASGVSVGDGAHTTKYTHAVYAYAPESPDPTVTLVGGIFGYSGSNSYSTGESGNPGAIGQTHSNSGFTVNSAVQITGTAVAGLRYIRNVCEDLIPGETYTITADVTVSSNNNSKTVGFGGAGIPPTEARIGVTGVISYTWTATGSDVWLFKGKNVACVVSNISIVVTPQDQPRYPKFRINTSSNDNTITTFKTSVTNAADTTIDNDAYNGGNDTVAFYVHPLVVNGAKWAVQASGIAVTTPSDPLNLLRTVTKTDGYLNSGTWTSSNSYQGLHANVVKVTVAVVGTMPAWNIDSICKFVVTPTLTQS